MDKLYAFLNKADAFVESDIYLNVKMIMLGLFFIIMAGYIVAKLIWRKK